MDEIKALLKEIEKLVDTDENKRRQSLWMSGEPAIRGEIQWHGIPAGYATKGDSMPITVEEMNAIWAGILGFGFDRYYREPEYYLKYLLMMKIEKFRQLNDDTPIDRNIPIWLGIPYEAGMLGQKYFITEKEEPTFGKEPVITESFGFNTEFDFEETDYLKTAKRFYQTIKNIVGSEFNVIFPFWIRGPQGMALYLRGYEKFLTDLYLDPEFAHRVLRYATDAAKAYTAWRAEYLSDPIRKGDLFNDDIPIMSPEMYETFIFPYERELCDYFGGIYYWHSCGDTTPHITQILRLPVLDLFDIGPGVKNKKQAIQQIGQDKPTEIRFAADRCVQRADENEMQKFVEETVESCRECQVEKYVIRVSGLSVLLGAKKDLEKLRTWIKVARRVLDG